jgi:penicillin-insensitive murein endopeptidase
LFRKTIIIILNINFREEIMSIKSLVFMSLFLFAFSSKSAEVVGFYSNGELWRADSVLDHDPKFTKLFLNREKNYTSNEMRSALQELADFVQSQYSKTEVLQVGDLSARGGGPAPRHVSHQNGIDADLVYLRKNRDSQSPNQPEWAERFVRNQKITRNFDLVRNWELLKYTVENYDVGRIFVDRVIKRSFCEYARKNNILERKDVVAFLRRLRPARYHDTHFHIRLKCPEGHNRCDEQHAPPQGHGCGEYALSLISETC